MNGIPKDCKALGKLIEDWFFDNGMAGFDGLFERGDGEYLIKHLVEYGVVMVPVEPTLNMIEAAKSIPDMQEVDNIVIMAANRGQKLTWLDRGVPPPLTQSIKASIDASPYRETE